MESTFELWGCGFTIMFFVNRCSPCNMLYALPTDLLKVIIFCNFNGRNENLKVTSALWLAHTNQNRVKGLQVTAVSKWIPHCRIWNWLNTTCMSDLTTYVFGLTCVCLLYIISVQFNLPCNTMNTWHKCASLDSYYPGLWWVKTSS